MKRICANIPISLYKNLVERSKLCNNSVSDVIRELLFIGLEYTEFKQNDSTSIKNIMVNFQKDLGLYTVATHHMLRELVRGNVKNGEEKVKATQEIAEETLSIILEKLKC